MTLYFDTHPVPRIEDYLTKCQEAGFLNEERVLRALMRTQFLSYEGGQGILLMEINGKLWVGFVGTSKVEVFSSNEGMSVPQHMSRFTAEVEAQKAVESRDGFFYWS